MKEYQVINILEGIYEEYVRDNDKDYMERNTALTEAVKALTEIQYYRSIGTVEECREARERKRAKKPIMLDEQSAKSEGRLYIAKYFKCPTCGNTSTYFGGLPNNCHNCGQALLQECDNE